MLQDTKYQIEYRALSLIENLKTKYFPNSLTKTAFTWFTTLPYDLIHNWV